ncbi:MAG: DNA mismatch repair protein MutS [Planctomycetes bacterium]|nr:DNA mismatch repair protein MutS [Planctomycetota bacterium]
MTTIPENATPAMRQWHEMKAQHPDKILMFRMGDFYEMFYDDAVRAADLAGLVLTKHCRDKSSPPLAGVPHHQLQRYIKEFIDKGVSVAVADQLEDPSQAKGVVKRGITLVQTPGTVVDDSVLPAVQNNFLAAACIRQKQAAVALVDLSTGEFLVLGPDADRVADVFERFTPAETLVPSDCAPGTDSAIGRLLEAGLGGGVTRRDGYQFDPHEGETLLKKHFGVDTLSPYGLEGKPAAIGAAGAILAYLGENLLSSLAHLRPPRVRDESNTLRIDRNTIRNLELVPPRGGDRRNTLQGVLDETLTGPGGRLLRNWLLAPPAVLDEIHRRQYGVGELMGNRDVRRELRGLFDRMADFERILARVAAERATPRDLSTLAAGIRRLPDIAALAGSCEAPILADRGGMDTLTDLADHIDDVLVPDPPAQIRDGGLVRDGYDREVDGLREIMGGGKDWIRSFQEAEQARTGITSLKVGFNKVFGYYIEITNAHKDKAPPDYIRKQTLVNAERYITPELKEQEERVLGAEEKLLAREQEIFVNLRLAVGREIRRVQETAGHLAELDVVAALAETGDRGGFVMPEVHDGLDTIIEGGRHPVVERLMPAGSFVDNDTRFDPETQRILVITGPNMSGKSTYIRQVALLFIMAHMGAPVPARAARIGLADRIFSRVGASDDLARGQSTFMVEMVETAEILHNATDRSLIILDEVGRGTSTFDGVFLAWAITEYLHQVIKARTLFATHYHELAELGLILPQAKNYNVAVHEGEGTVVFLRKIQPGACDRSYGIHVGRLAGIPPEVLKRADEILAGLEEQASERDSKMLDDSRELLRAAARDVQRELFPSPQKMDEVARRLARELADGDINLLAPLAAPALLGRLAERAKWK